jgi:hypothetical protein
MFYLSFPFPDPEERMLRRLSWRQLRRFTKVSRMAG